jgi:hypothetical protein
MSINPKLRYGTRSTDVLVYQNNADVFPLRELVKGGLDGGCLGLVVDDEEVLLGIGA